MKAVLTFFLLCLAVYLYFILVEHGVDAFYGSLRKRKRRKAERREAMALYEELSKKKYSAHPYRRSNYRHDMTILEEDIWGYWKPRYFLDHRTKCAYEFMDTREHFTTIRVEDIEMDTIPVRFRDRAERLVGNYPVLIGGFDNGVAEVQWMLQPDGRYYRDSDGYGMTDDDEVSLYGFVDRRGRVVGTFICTDNHKEVNARSPLAEKKANTRKWKK